MQGGGAGSGDGTGQGATRAGPVSPVPAADEPEGASTRRREGTPRLALDGFDGPLDHLLALARAQAIDLSAISLPGLIEQLSAALRQAPATMPLGQKADWIVMAAWLMQLRSRLLLPADAPEQRAATAEADQLRGQLRTFAEAQALAGWLQVRPQLGRDVFARGQPEVFAQSVEVGAAIDVIEFLWASMALFDDGTAEPDTEAVYRPVALDLHTVAEARDRILRILGETPGGAPFERLLPEPAASGLRQALRRRSAWSSTLMASLELARQGVVVMGQEEDFEAIQVTRK